MHLYLADLRALIQHFGAKLGIVTRLDRGILPLELGILPRELGQKHIEALQDALMEDDCYIPWHTREIPPLTLSAKCSAEVVRNGLDRGEENCFVGKAGDTVKYSFDTDTDIREIRLIFDSDLNRKYHNMPCNYPLVQDKFKLPKTLIKEYKIVGISENGESCELHVTDNRKRFVKHYVNWRIKELTLIPIATHGEERFRIFDFEVK